MVRWVGGIDQNIAKPVGPYAGHAEGFCAQNIVGAAGKYTSDRVIDDLRRRRRRSEADTAEMIVYAALCNGKYGLVDEVMV